MRTLLALALLALTIAGGVVVIASSFEARPALADCTNSVAGGVVVVASFDMRPALAGDCGNGNC